ncbi:hypothetical protein OF385_05570 [Glutamicibacter sp. JL.03c]|uniref:hypothetical protein n=1 Tax=Glutamicibacter sp. JL.03c TaxID=2984842 RepID=UPI0021F6BA35|nr:hypothetical protein [Glutamicibacter sp. JL.03c]UYQ78612.1 hypothetical protein OF385_05570 [Glutamicibacter sp. JL.03c]
MLGGVQLVDRQVQLLRSGDRLDVLPAIVQGLGPGRPGAGSSGPAMTSADSRMPAGTACNQLLLEERPWSPRTLISHPSSGCAWSSAATLAPSLSGSADAGPANISMVLIV